MFHKKEISEFLQTDYSDEKLQSLLEAAKNKMVCWIYPDTCLVGRSDNYNRISLTYSIPAQAYKKFEQRSGWFSFGVRDANKNLIPLIEKEIQRRAEGRQLTKDLERVKFLTEESSSETLSEREFQVSLGWGSMD